MNNDLFEFADFLQDKITKYGVWVCTKNEIVNGESISDTLYFLNRDACISCFKTSVDRLIAVGFTINRLYGYGMNECCVIGTTDISTDSVTICMYSIWFDSDIFKKLDVKESECFFERWLAHDYYR